jgi:type II secretory pathway component PulJ
MAGAKLSGKAKIKASSILEVIVAMVIIVVIFGMGMMIYANVTRSSLSAQKIQARAILLEELNKAEQTRGLATQSMDTAGFRVEQEVAPYPDDTLLSVIRLTAYDLNQNKISELQKVILHD